MYIRTMDVCLRVCRSRITRTSIKWEEGIRIMRIFLIVRMRQVMACKNILYVHGCARCEASNIFIHTMDTEKNPRTYLAHA